jgi:uncharacterized LabA/DUF88 family protein
VTSDSDFTRLAARIREHGLIVYGFGEKKTPRPFVAACDKFVYTELLTPAEDKPAGAATKIPTAALRQDTKLINLIDNSIKASMNEDSDWVDLGFVGQHMGKQAPEFDARNYGYAKLSSLIEAIGLYEIDRTEKHIRIRRKPRKA